MFERISKALYEDLQVLKGMSLELPSPFKYKVINTSMVGEIEVCYAMDWSIAMKTNYPGADAIDDSGKLIQIKTFVQGLKTKMLPAFNPAHPKNREVSLLAIAVLDLKLNLFEVLISDIPEYSFKLKEVELGREIRKKTEKRVIRYDLQISEFREIPGVQVYDLMSFQKHKSKLPIEK